MFLYVFCITYVILLNYITRRGSPAGWPMASGVLGAGMWSVPGRLLMIASLRRRFKIEIQMYYIDAL